MKTHLKITGVDCRDSGQRQWEYDHQTACGYVRRYITRNKDDVDCFYCLRSKEFQLIQSVEGK